MWHIGTPPCPLGREHWRADLTAPKGKRNAGMGKARIQLIIARSSRHRAISALDDVGDRAGLALDQAIDPGRDRLQRAVDDAAHVLGQIAHALEHAIDVGQRLLDAMLAEEGIKMIAPHKRNRKKAATQDGRPLRRYRRRWKEESPQYVISSYDT